MDLVEIDFTQGTRFTVDYLLSLVSKRIGAKIRSGVDDKKAALSLWGELLVRCLACSQLGVANQDIDIALDTHGKPYLSSYPEFYFNISHSVSRVLCVTDSLPVGVDIEQIRPIDLDVARIWYSPDEYAVYMAAPVNERLELFYDIWTLKESYAKAIGLGLDLDPKSFTVIPDGERGATLLASPSHPARFFRIYHLDDRYRVAVCSCSEHFPDQIRRIKPHTLLEQLGVTPHS